MMNARILALALLPHLVAAGAERIPWTTSRIQGSPEPPLPYVAERAFPKLTFQNALELVAQGGQFYVVERTGKIWAFPASPDTAKAVLVVDLKASELRAGNLYGLAFHPRWQKNHQVFLTYTSGPDRLKGVKMARFRLTPGSPPSIDPASVKVMLSWRNTGHSGGNLQFGPDGLLYVAVGDGTEPSPPDKLNTGQDTSDLLASILRIDVDQSTKSLPYRVPADNPFVGVKYTRPEIWAFGFRQPWKMSFDPRGRLWVGDVGWELWEMIHLVEKGGNYGWSAMEASEPIKPATANPLAPIRAPIVAHPHSEAASITGGFVYRGQRLPELRGAYVYGDYETGKIWALRHDGRNITHHQEIADTTHRIATFGEGENGELFYAHYGTPSTLHRLSPNPSANPPQPFPTKLSQTGLFKDVARQTPADGVHEFKIAEPMWQDNASTRRLIALPGKSKIKAEQILDSRGRPKDPVIQWPNDSVLARTITPPNSQPVETQLLHFNGDQWNGYSYRWNTEGTDATLVDKNGANLILPNGQRHRFHSRVECLRCHNSWNGHALAFNPLQLARSPETKNDPVALGLTDPDFFKRKSIARLVPSRSKASLTDRARSWLHANCAHCHRRHGGGAAPLEINIEQPLDRTATIDAPPTRGGFGLATPHVITPGAPWQSVLPYRVAALGAAHMPPLGSNTIDSHGLQLLWDWIEQMPSKTTHKKPKPSLKTTSGAFSYLANNQTNPKALRDGLNSPNANIRALFERHRPPTERPAQLGIKINPKTILNLRGDAHRGKAILSPTGKWAACYACHTLQGKGRSLGPDLSQIGARHNKPQILDSLLNPAQIIAPPYRIWLIKTKNDKSHMGFILRETETELILKLPTGQAKSLPKNQIQARQPRPESLMPAGLLQTLTPQEAADVLAWLASLK
ncbi:MAG: hypothetical protein CMO74_08075 [Verrucomicrobiales bacterium]|nr:hypothetical protein [Verrucomicrobiales bacterium]|tara:strand:+ start:9554 stop:12295 length:2742 start_codon:yes stop_codon:yes gene_type:complete